MLLNGMSADFSVKLLREDRGKHVYFLLFLGYFELLCAATSQKCVSILLTSSKLLINNQTYKLSNHP